MEERDYLINLREAAKRLAVNPSRLQDVQYRRRINLVGVKIGGSLKFRPIDIDAIIKANTEEVT